jgi:hypothetical protein
MNNDNIRTATVPQQKGTQGRENPTPVNTLSKNPTKKG